MERAMVHGKFTVAFQDVLFLLCPCLLPLQTPPLSQLSNAMAIELLIVFLPTVIQLLHGSRCTFVVVVLLYELLSLLLLLLSSSGYTTK